MRAAFARALLAIWIVLYFILTAPIFIVLSFIIGPVAFVLLMIAVGTIWSLLFYLILSMEGTLERVRSRLDGASRNKLLIKLTAFLGKRFWIYLVFAICGGLFGVIALKTFGKGSLRADLLTLLVGSIAGAVPLIGIMALMTNFLPVEVKSLWGWFS